jgi:hypothetical protein
LPERCRRPVIRQIRPSHVHYELAAQKIRISLDHNETFRSALQRPTLPLDSDALSYSRALLSCYTSHPKSGGESIISIAPSGDRVVHCGSRPVACSSRLTDARRRCGCRTQVSEPPVLATDCREQQGPCLPLPESAVGSAVCGRMKRWRGSEALDSSVAPPSWSVQTTYLVSRPPREPCVALLPLNVGVHIGRGKRPSFARSCPWRSRP